MSIDDGSPGIPAVIPTGGADAAEDGPIDRAGSGGAEGTGSDGPGLADRDATSGFSSDDTQTAGPDDADPPR